MSRRMPVTYLRRRLHGLAQLNRGVKTSLAGLTDFFLVAFCFLAAMALRLDDIEFALNYRNWLVLGALVFTSLAAFSWFGLYRSVVRYLNGTVLLIIAKGTLVSTVALIAADFFWNAEIPRSVPPIYAILLFGSVAAVRFVVRDMFRQPRVSNRRPVIIYGAGSAGVQLLNYLTYSRDYRAVAFVDDELSLQGQTVGGLSVFSPERLQDVVVDSGANLVLLAIPTAERARRREIVRNLQKLELEIKTIPSLSQVISGKAKVSEVRHIDPEDLLGRDAVIPDISLLERNITGKVVMITGAGGTIGSELCRQVLSLRPSLLLLYEMSEGALYTIGQELAEISKRTGSSSKVVSVLGSVVDAPRVNATINSYCVQTIYHAAAHKHVPIVEENILEGIRNNVFGTLAVASAALVCKVENFIFISTDKAVRPTNVMGATKRIGELICQAFSTDGGSTSFSMVRFGNVLGSSGSVIPLFRAQIEREGPVTVTHRDITRYFMTISEAAQLVIQAGAMAKGGDVFVLDMGQPVRIMDLARDMIRLHGLTPYEIEHPDEVFPERGDIPILITGLRKGEKLYEELLIGNNPTPTQHPRIMSASEVSLSKSELLPVLDRLAGALDAFDLTTAVHLLKELPLEYSQLEYSASDLSLHRN